MFHFIFFASFLTSICCPSHRIRKYAQADAKKAEEKAAKAAAKEKATAQKVRGIRTPRMPIL